MNTAAIPTHTLFQNLTSQEFGRLTVIGFAGYKSFPSGQKAIMWQCRCSCGKTVAVLARLLKCGGTKSCGCSRKSTTLDCIDQRGKAAPRTPEYRAWAAMKTRCYNPNYSEFDSYGGRGIIVDPSWINDFPAFLAHIGPRPSAKHSIDRIENDGNYEPGNVRWATLETQVNNKRNNIILTHEGVSMTMPQWAKKLGVERHVIKNRIRYGWPIEKILTTPPRYTKK